MTESRTSQAGLRVAEVADPDSQASTVAVRVAELAAVDARYSTAVIRVAVRESYDLTWSGETLFMNDVVFPTHDSLGSDGGPGWFTDIQRVDSGHVQTNQRWDQPLYEYTRQINKQNYNVLNQIRRIWNAAAGPARGFKMHDWWDYSSMPDQPFVGAPVITPTDQPLGTGDDRTTTFQLIKRYQVNSQFMDRDISKPKDGTVVVAINSAPWTAFTVDTTTGLVTFTPDLIVAGTDISFQAAGNQINSVTSDFSGFFSGDEILVEGAAEAGNNADAANPFTVQPASSANQLLVDGPLTDEAAGAAVTVSRHPAPRTGTVLTAGYEFYVPVRFVTDLMKVIRETHATGQVVIDFVETRDI